MANLKMLKITFTIFLIALIAAFAFYSTFYSMPLSENNLTNAIEKYTKDSNVTLLATEREGNHIIALYTTEEPYYSGIVVFRRGWNGLWAPVEYSKGTDICMTTFWSPFAGNQRHVIGGIDCDPRIVSYEVISEYPDVENYETSGNTEIFRGNVSEPNFIHIYESGRYSHMPYFKIYDSAGNNIEPELAEAMRNDGIEKE